MWQAGDNHYTQPALEFKVSYEDSGHQRGYKFELSDPLDFPVNDWSTASKPFKEIRNSTLSLEQESFNRLDHQSFTGFPSQISQEHFLQRWTPSWEEREWNGGVGRDQFDQSQSRGGVHFLNTNSICWTHPAHSSHTYSSSLNMLASYSSSQAIDVPISYSIIPTQTARWNQVCYPTKVSQISTGTQAPTPTMRSTGTQAPTPTISNQTSTGQPRKTVRWSNPSVKSNGKLEKITRNVAEATEKIYNVALVDETAFNPFAEEPRKNSFYVSLTTSSNDNPNGK